MVSARKGVDTRIGARSRMFLRDRGLSNWDSGPDDATCLTGWPPDELEQHFNISSTHRQPPHMPIALRPAPTAARSPSAAVALAHRLPAARSRSAAFLRCDLYQPPQNYPAARSLSTNRPAPTPAYKETHHIQTSRPSIIHETPISNLLPPLSPHLQKNARPCCMTPGFMPTGTLLTP